MNGYIALLGSGEYLPVMDEVDQFLLAHCGAAHRKPRVVCLPTAAGDEGPKSVKQWSEMGVAHFTRLGADVRAIPVTDAESANDENHAQAVAEADLIYFSGGNPNYLFRTLNHSLVWKAAQKAWQGGAVYAGCSAGAMILSREMPDFRAAGIRSMAAFDLLPISSILPHYDALPLFGKPLIATLRRRLDEGELMLGIDEETAVIGKLNEEWLVMGKAKAHMLTKAEIRTYAAGEKFSLGKQNETFT
ncbi:MAG: Type 1 glutamine amidotransferase-like domain-containing protein [Anaerolineales bacterium]|nr:Type 1 glutamine amidotransferase-like domain-containing protein [Anaerolineales bacterium]